MNFLLSCTSDDSSSSNAVNYSFEIEQAMREETLENVVDIGIAVKKVND